MGFDVLKEFALDESENASGAYQERERLKQIIRDKSLLTAEVNGFELASGGKSTYFFDMKTVLLDPEGANLIAKCLFEKIKDCDVKYVGGLEAGAIPLVTALCLISWKSSRPLYGFFVRKEPKKRGTRKTIEGNLKEGEKVIIVDDVTTKGGSVIKAIKEVQNLNCKVAKVLSVVDRESGAHENLKQMGVAFDALFKKSEFGV
ncbi:MAG: orotate phosphoribosyltransferase [Candidatus Jordarchaeum sp.]|uniref:orotate phosphoribosyltransferase n=1 Tax=Candidatus Jordarchaeum sp. TaxID=2823881 RepID=UPI00404A24D8